MDTGEAEFARTNSYPLILISMTFSGTITPSFHLITSIIIGRLRDNSASRLPQDANDDSSQLPHHQVYSKIHCTDECTLPKGN